jgi:hypothetical protein
MNTKFSFALLVGVIALVATACAPAIIDSSAPIAPVNPAANNETSALVPVTGESASNAVRAPQESRLFSGEIFLSDNNNPDNVQNAEPAVNQKPQSACRSADSLPPRQGGCIE